MADARLSDHFWLGEFTRSITAARLGIDNTPPPDVIETLRYTAHRLEIVRALIGHPIIILSGFRCRQLNAATPGSSVTSQHILGEAADIISPGFGTPLALCRAIALGSIAFDQMIYEYQSWCHISFRSIARLSMLTIDTSGVRGGIEGIEA
jgi:zinc D-Ala-D-Ala carboxypeptidase